MNAAVQDVKEWISLKLKTGHCSSVLIQQMADSQVGIGVVFKEVRHYFSPLHLYSVIEEQESGVGPELKKFRKKSKLCSLYHVHHSSAYFVEENVRRNWQRKVEQSGLGEQGFWEEKFSESVFEMIAKGIPEQEAIKRAYFDVSYKELREVMGEFDRTGEWLIIARHEESNYYLCLAFHDEAQNDFEAIVKKLTPCVEEYPFLKQLMSG
jgi:hypothetical protein